MPFWRFKRRIGPDKYITRFFLIPRNRWFNLYLHRYDGPDNRDYGLHDHPWWSLSIRLWGKFLVEDRGLTKSRRRFADGTEVNTLKATRLNVVLPRVVIRKAIDAHSIIDGDWPVWTLFITGRNIRTWGFHTPFGWVPHDEVISFFERRDLL